jgi:hypothetical protein
LMISIGGLIGDADREERDECCEQIKPGVRSFGKDSQAAGGEAHNQFQGSNGDCSEHRLACDSALFIAHRIRAVGRRGACHERIIAA